MATQLLAIRNPSLYAAREQRRNFTPSCENNERGWRKSPLQYIKLSINAIATATPSLYMFFSLINNLFVHKSPFVLWFNDYGSIESSLLKIYMGFIVNDNVYVIVKW